MSHRFGIYQRVYKTFIVPCPVCKASGLDDNTAHATYDPGDGWQPAACPDCGNGTIQVLLPVNQLISIN
ncbi:MAG TPA: hypothetical protein VM163_13995 [bacterium]|nr:hypothetical protein [bacterium]